jgi:hypothetical protein
MAESALRRAISVAITSALAMAVSGVSDIMQVSHESLLYGRTMDGDIEDMLLQPS